MPARRGGARSHSEFPLERRAPPSQRDDEIKITFKSVFTCLIYFQGRPNISFKDRDLSFALIWFEGYPGFAWNMSSFE